jgi:hypothetical protein
MLHFFQPIIDPAGKGLISGLYMKQVLKLKKESGFSVSGRSANGITVTYSFLKVASR